jgi:hypothetical protein
MIEWTPSPRTTSIAATPPSTRAEASARENKAHLEALEKWFTDSTSPTGTEKIALPRGISLCARCLPVVYNLVLQEMHYR